MLISTTLFLYANLSAYNLAACIMEDLTLFKAWTLTTSPAQLQQMQSVTGVPVAWIYLITKTAMTVMTPFLVSEEPRLWWCIAAMAVSWGSSFLVQIPLQLKVRETGDRAAMKRLARTTKVRTWSMIVHAAVVGWVVWGTMQ